MPILITLFAIILILIVLLLTVALKIVVVLDTDNDDVYATFYWLYPLLKGKVELVDSLPVLSVYLLNLRVYKKAIKARKGKKGRKGLQLLKSVDLQNVIIRADYGFRDNFIAGITCGAICYISSFVEAESIEVSPDFLAAKDYIHVNATARMNIFTNLKALLATKKTVKET